MYGPPLPVILPNGNPVPDPYNGGYMMSPVPDLRPVAAEGRKTGEVFRSLLNDPESGAGAIPYLISKLFLYLYHFGYFDYQRIGAGPILGHFRPFTYINQFRPVANFNVGLFCQQAGLSLDETPRIAGTVAAHTIIATPNAPHGLPDLNEHFITEGFNAGASGMFGPSAMP